MGARSVRSLWSWAPAVAYMALIFSISSLSLRGAHLPRSSDKLIHFVEYGVLAVLVTFALRRTRPDLTPRAVALRAFAVAAVYGLSDEVHQLFVPYRSASVYDWFADATGAALAAALLVWVCKEMPRAPDDPGVPRQDP